MKILHVGATGLVGRLVLARLLESPQVARVVAPTRRSLGITHPRLHNPVVDFEALPEDAEWWAVDAVICTLGTTIADAGSQAAFRRVDHDYPLQVARLARRHGARGYALNSAMGANARSTVGTATDTHAMLRMLFSRLGQPHVGSSQAFSFNVPSVSGAGAIKKADGTKERREFSITGGMCPRCVVGPQSLAAWATADEATAAEMARERRCALWRPGEGGAAGLVAMVEAMRARGQYRGGKDAVAFRP